VSLITQLWSQGIAPGWDGLYRASGSAQAARVDGAKLSAFVLGESLDLGSLLTQDPEWVTQIDICAEAKMPNGAGILVCGDGAHGSEGFFARLSAGRQLVWLVYLSNSNPFMRVGVDGSMATFVNNLDHVITVDLAGEAFISA
jgi:hypothetical protein